MNEKESYSPEEFSEVMRIYSGFKSVYGHFYTSVCKLESKTLKSEEVSPGEIMTVKELGLRVLDSLLDFERKVPKNITGRFIKELEQCEESIRKEVNRRDYKI